MDRTGFFLMEGSKLSFEIRLFKQCYSAGLLFHKEASINYVTRVGGGSVAETGGSLFRNVKDVKRKRKYKNLQCTRFYIFFTRYTFKGPRSIVVIRAPINFVPPVVGWRVPCTFRDTAWWQLRGVALQVPCRYGYKCFPYLFIREWCVFSSFYLIYFVFFLNFKHRDVSLVY